MQGRTAAVVFAGVNKCHGQKLKFMPMTGVHTLVEAAQNSLHSLGRAMNTRYAFP